jgi:hypothetical protein
VYKRISLDMTSSMRKTSSRTMMSKRCSEYHTNSSIHHDGINCGKLYTTVLTLAAKVLHSVQIPQKSTPPVRFTMQPKL